MSRNAVTEHLRSRWLAHPELSRRIILAVSGGADSVALLRASAELADELALELTVAHFNHRTRPEDNTADAAWLAALCNQLGLRCEQGTRDGNAGPAAENELRQARRGFLANVARKHSADVVCLAHHADDQAETIVHRLCRGTGPAGLAGMAEVSPLNDDVVLFRPLLSLPGSDLRDYLAEIRQDYREDDSNASPRYTRNRIRHQVLPLLEDIHPGAATSIARLGDQLRESLELQQTLAGQLLKEAVIDTGPDCVRLRIKPLAAAPALIAREALVQLWTRQAWPRQGMTRAHWERLQATALPEGRDCDMPGRIRVSRRAEMLVLERS